LLYRNAGAFRAGVVFDPDQRIQEDTLEGDLTRSLDDVDRGK